MESSMQGGVFKYKVENLGVLYIGTSNMYLWQHKLGNYVEQAENTASKQIKSTNRFMYTNYECTPHLQGNPYYERGCVQIRTTPHSWIAWSMTMSMLVTEYFIHSQTIMQTWRLFGWGEVINDFLSKLAKLEPSKFILLSSY
jgi:hypothetical protein